MAELVRFYTGPVDNYIAGYAKGEYKNGIFFSTDDHSIWKDGEKYGTAAAGNSGVSQDWVDEKYGSAFNEVNIVKDASGFTLEFVDVEGTIGYSILIPVATFEQMGLMSAADKGKLNSIKAENILYKEEGKGLSSNDFTDEHKELLESVEANAEPNVLEVVKVDGIALENINKTVNIELVDKIHKVMGDQFGTVYTFKGSVDNIEELPTNASTGDVYNITNESIYGPEGVNVAWTGTEWDSLGGTLSTVNYDAELGKIKQDIQDLNGRVDVVENETTKITALEQSIKTLNSDDSVDGSVANTATTIASTIIEQMLTWQTI